MNVISLNGGIPQDTEVSPSIRDNINGYWRTVQTHEDLQRAWQDLQVQLAIDKTVHPLPHEATKQWAIGEMKSLAVARHIDRDSLKDNAEAPLDLGSIFTFLGDAPAVAPRELIKKLLPADGVAITGGQPSAGKTTVK